MIEENPIEVEEPAEVEVHEEQHPKKEPEYDEFQVGRIDFMPVGTTLEGGRIVDPRFLPHLVCLPFHLQPHQSSWKKGKFPCN